MSKILLALLIVASMLMAAGCNMGDVTPEQQKAKKDALQKVADENPDPNREKRPQ